MKDLDKLYDIVQKKRILKGVLLPHNLMYPYYKTVAPEEESVVLPGRKKTMEGVIVTWQWHRRTPN